ncbi:MAG: hypothetical protein V3U28_06720 [Candidatus Acidoferrales bacterium]
MAVRGYRGMIPRHLPGWLMPLLTPQRTLTTGRYYPVLKQRLGLGGDRHPYWHVMDFVLGARASDDQRVLPEKNFILLSMTASAQQIDRSFRGQFYQVVDADSGKRTSRTGLNRDNYLGIAEWPWILKWPYPMPDGQIFMARVANLNPNNNNIQVVLYGVMESDIPGVPAEAY